MPFKLCKSILLCVCDRDIKWLGFYTWIESSVEMLSDNTYIRILTLRYTIKV